jgi:hypothetical protein
MIWLTVLGTFGALLLAYILSGGDIFEGSARVRDFYLCSAEEMKDGRPASLSSNVISPTTLVHVCGYLEISGTFHRPICLRFIMPKGDDLLWLPGEYCEQETSGYFSYDIETQELLYPGTYLIEVLDVSNRTWTRTIKIEIQ